MSNSRKIPITNKATGETTQGNPSNTPAVSKNVIPIPESQWNKAELKLERPLCPGVDSQDSGKANKEIQSKDRPHPAEPKEKTRRSINNLEQLIAHAYERRGQQFKLKPSDEKVLCQQPKLEEDARKRLLNLAKNDELLAVPRQLLLIVRDILGYPLIKSEVRDFVRDVLLQHPIFSSPKIVSAIRNLPDSPNPEKALIMLAEMDLSAFTGFFKSNQLKPKEFEALCANASYCLAVWFAETRGLSFEKLNLYLYSSLWKPKTHNLKDETSRLRFLTEIQDLAGVGLACSAFKKQADEQIFLTVAAKRGEESALEKIASLENSIERLRRDMNERDRQIADLEQELIKERRNHEHTRAHLRDDFEHLRTRLLRRLKAEVSLLAEGLHAIRRVPPKIHVMEDHAERALDALQKEIQDLESEN